MKPAAMCRPKRRQQRQTIASVWDAATHRSLVLLALGAAAWLLSGCGTQAKSVESPTPVRVAPVEQYAGEEGMVYSANIVPYTQVDLAFKSGGYVSSIAQRKGSDGHMRSLQQGDFVGKGTVLAVVREDEYRDQLSHAQAQLARAQASYDQARQSMDRATVLYKSASLTKPDYDSAKANYDAAEASVKDARAGISQAQIAMKDCQLKAPVDGWIVKRNVEVGSLVGPSVVGFSMVDTHLVKAVFGVPDRMISRVHLGRTQAITTDAVAGDFQGRVTAISPVADPKSRVYSVEVTIANSKDVLKAGMIASLTLGGTRLSQAMPSVPLGAIVRSNAGDGFAVFVPEAQGDHSIVHQRKVELGDPHGNQMSVRGGVSPGESVVVSGPSLLREGQAVQVIP